jgi:hypothetical protein
MGDDVTILEDKYRMALEYIVTNALFQGAWYVETAREALGEDHPLNIGTVLYEIK